MRKDRYNKRKFHSKSLTLVLAISLAFVLVISCSVGATLAWLKDTTTPVVNTFTYGDINITLTETDAAFNQTSSKYEKSFKMVPGNKIVKDPLVTVKGGSEACWLFVKVETSGRVSDFLTYSVDSSIWTQLENTSDVYYREVSSSNEDQKFYVLTGDSSITNGTNGVVTVNTTVTKTMMNEIDGIVPISDNATDDEKTQAAQTAQAELANAPKLTFIAYAIQKDHFDSAADAWAEINN